MSPSTESHLTQLRRKHETVDAELREAAQHLGTAYTDISRLKRRKLRLKDEIGRIEATVH